MIYFGPSGNSDSFTAEGHKRSAEAPAWLFARGLNAYEYPFGRGVRLSAEGAAEIAAEANKYGIQVSAHAPYFINLANPDKEKRENSFRYILESAARVKQLGGERIVVHIGAQQKQARKDALQNCRDGIWEAYRRLDDAGLSDIRICAETMGKMSQIGDLTETLQFCRLDERLIPCIDFAHLHALSNGGLQTAEDFARVLDETENILGLERARNMHVHFSTIEYTKAGEKRHHTFAETDYGPRFELLAPLFWERKYEPTIICESKGAMAEDAAAMRDMYRALTDNRM